MSEPQKIYAVTEGDYSDYRVLALFTSEELAKQHTEEADLPGDFCPEEKKIEEFYLYDRPPEMKTVYHRIGRVDSDGKAIQDSTISERRYEYGNYMGFIKPIMEARTYSARSHPNCLQVSIIGSDSERVDKSFNDRMAEAKARQAGI
jgi:hypothetical protein